MSMTNGRDNENQNLNDDLEAEAAALEREERARLDADFGEEPSPEQIEAAAAALAEENAEMKDRLLRQAADMENLRKRTEREKRDAGQYAISNFARDVLNIGDDLERALAAVPDDQVENPAIKALTEGVQMTQNEFTRTLEKHGVTLITPMGEKFDPNMHQAMFEVADPTAVPGTVLQVMQSGYSIGERVLRPALVGVAKKAPPAPAAEPGEGDGPAEGHIDRTV